MQKCVLVYSGGLDSTTLLYYMRSLDYDVHCLSVHYGQRHKIELQCAETVCKDLGITHKTLDLSPVQELLGGSALTDGIAVPHGHYAEESMKQTVVPNRNMILLSLAIGWAVSLKAKVVVYGAHAGDHAIYPDCRPEFIDAMAKAALICDWDKVELIAPFQTMSKGEIVEHGARLGVPFEKTWTCYEGNQETREHCGKCGSCTERMEAFKLAGVPDPTKYAAQ